MSKLRELYAKDINREIQGVIKVDDETFIKQELEEYVVTDELLKHFRNFFDSYNAKKEYKDLRKTMDKKNYANLETVFKNIKFGQTIETVLILINIVDQLIKNLPLTLLNDIDIGFYNLIKKQL